MSDNVLAGHQSTRAERNTPSCRGDEMKTPLHYLPQEFHASQPLSYQKGGKMGLGMDEKNNCIPLYS